MALTVTNAPYTGTVSVGNAAPTGGVSVVNSSPSQGTSQATGNYGAYDQGFSTGVLGASTSSSYNGAPATGGGTGYANSNGGGSTYNPAAAAAAKAAAEAQAKVAGFRSTIQNLSKSIMDVYDQLYGAVNSAGADQARQVNAKYDLQSKGLTDQLNQDLPTVGASYEGRGAYDSSYRGNAEDNVGKAYNQQMDLQGLGRQEDLAKVGQFVAENQGSINADRSGINAVLDRINNTEDPNELLTLQNTIQQKLQSAQANQASLGTQGGYAAQARAIAPAQDQTAALQSQLHSIIAGQAAPALKQSVGAKLIANSGLAPDQQQALLQDLVNQIATQDKIAPQQ